MHQLPTQTWKINEIFASLQGEGLRQGDPTIFIRLAGCNLRCPFCDTSYAWEKGSEHNTARILRELTQAAADWPADWICITGGEPLLQDLSELVPVLQSAGYKIQIETNGTRYQQLDVDWYTVSPKPPNYETRPEFLSLAREVKLIVTEDLNFSQTAALRSRFPEKTPLLLQPQSNRPEYITKALSLLTQLLKNGDKNIRLSCQMHKFLKLR